MGEEVGIVLLASLPTPATAIFQYAYSPASKQETCKLCRSGINIDCLPGDRAPQ